MASGDILLSAYANAVSGSWSNGPASVDFNLYNKDAANLDLGDIHLVARGDVPPYGQGWADQYRSPFKPGVTYEVTIKEV